MSCWKVTRVFVGAAAVLLAGCGDGKSGETSGASSAVGSANGGGTSDASESSGGTSGLSGGQSSVSGGTSSGGALIHFAGAAGQTSSTPEICDGIDNDGNGIIDDVDVAHDGVCDCLNIATVGHIGPWSNGGNVFSSWLNARSPLGAVALADEELTADKLRPFQIVVLLHVATSEVSSDTTVTPAHHAFSNDEASAFEAWVRAGGGVMSTIGYTYDEASEVVNVNKLLTRLGMGYSATKLDLGGNVQTWMTHPVTDGITNIFISNGVEPDGANGTTIAKGGDSVALQVAQVDKGRAAIWGDEWITYDSEWADVKGQQVEHFWLNLLKWLSPPTQCQVPIPDEVL